MFKQSDDDDDLFSSVGINSNLASIFNTTVVEDTQINSNASLTYSAPRQPQTPTKRTDGKSPSSISLVKLVYAYKFINNTSTPLGKFGLALVESNQQFSLILYKDKTKPLLNIKVNSRIQFTIQNLVYLTFYDDNQQSWSLLFDNADEIFEFEAKLQSAGAKINRLQSKDIYISNNAPCLIIYASRVEPILKTKFTGATFLCLQNELKVCFVDDNQQKWLLNFSSENDLNQFKVRLKAVQLKESPSELHFYSADEPSGYEPAIVPEKSKPAPIKKSSFNDLIKEPSRPRLNNESQVQPTIVNPISETPVIGPSREPSASITSKKSVVNTSLTTASTERSKSIELAKTSHNDLVDILPSKQIKSQESSISIAKSEDFKSKLASDVSDNEATDEANKKKELILSRMAKMGQAVIPVQSNEQLHLAKVNNSTDESTDLETKNPQRTSESAVLARLKKKRPSKKQLDFDGKQENAVTPYTGSPVTSNYLQENVNSLFVENRNHNTEMRLSLLKMDSKIDQIVNALHVESESALRNEILHLKSENESLKSDVNKLKEKTEQILNGRIQTEKNTETSTNVSRISDNTTQTKSQASTVSLPEETFLQLTKSTEEVEQLKEKYLNIVTDLETLQKKSALTEMRLKDLENYYVEHCSLQAFPNGNQLCNCKKPTLKEDYNDVYKKNVEIRLALSEMTNKVRESALNLQEQKARIAEIKMCFSDPANSEVLKSDKGGTLNTIKLKLKELEVYLCSTEEWRNKLDAALATIKSCELEVFRQDQKLYEILKKNSKCENCAVGFEEIENLKSKIDKLQNENKSKDENINVMQNHINELENKLKCFDTIKDGVKEKVKITIGPLIKEEMNELYSDLQEKLKDNCEVEVTSLIVQATYKIIQSIQSHMSLQ